MDTAKSAETLAVRNPPSQEIKQEASGQSSDNTKMEWKSIVLIVVSTLLLISIIANIVVPIMISKSNDDSFHSYKFNYWNDKSAALDSIVKFVKEVTKKGSKTFVPAKDRIAVFDMDGTLIGETSPTYLAYWHYFLFVKENQKLKDRGTPNPDLDPTYDYSHQNQIAEQLKALIIDPSGDWDSFEIPQMEAEAAAFQGFTLEKYYDHVTNFLEQDADKFNNAKNKDLYYKPMKEILEFLQKNKFKTYINSGTDREFCRVFAKILGIPLDNVIGTDMEFKANTETRTSTVRLNDNGHEFAHEEKVVKSGYLLYYNYRMGKVRTNAKEIGIQPILNFGNSGGDSSMNNYAISTSNKYPAKAFMLVADDINREFGIDVIGSDGKVDTTNSDSKKKKWKNDKYKFEIISMRDDFKTIYGEKVTIKNTTELFNYS